jgi:hypothetical protein
MSQPGDPLYVPPAPEVLVNPPVDLSPVDVWAHRKRRHPHDTEYERGHRTEPLIDSPLHRIYQQDPTMGEDDHGNR